jgi:hypothetical protein
MPLYATWMLFNSGSYLGYITTPFLQRFVYLVVFVTTFLMPALSSWFMVRQGKISSLEMYDRKERSIPFFFTLISFIACIFLLYKLPVPRLITLFVSGGAVIILYAFIVNLRWKISIHMIGIGGLMGMMFSYSYLFHVHMIYLLIGIAVLAGALGTARMILKAHSPGQVYAGFLSGFVIEAGYIWLVVYKLLAH